MTIDIRPVQTYAEYAACERLQQEVLGMSDLETVPYAQLQSFAQSGGAVIGAFDGGLMAGFVYGYTGLFPDGTPYHRSQRLAVLPQYRNQGLGERLKQAQADHARRHGLRLMCWVFDPLLARNAHLNLHKLGAFSRRYIENAYVASTSPRNAGAPTDRLWVEWPIGAGRPGQERPAAGGALDSAPVVLRREGNAPGAPDLACAAPAIVIAIPDDIDAIRAADVPLLCAWREATRQAFRHYFARGYTAVDFIRSLGYLLTAGGRPATAEQ